MQLASNNFDSAGDKFRAIGEAMGRLNEPMQLLQVQMASLGDSIRDPQQFNMGTPQQPTQQRQTQRPNNDDQPTMGLPGFSSIYQNLIPGPSV